MTARSYTFSYTGYKTFMDAIGNRENSRISPRRATMLKLKARGSNCR